MTITQFDFLFDVNWAQSITQTLEWKTDVLRATRGAEQRRAIRYYPRRMWEFSCIISGVQRQRFENLMARGGAGNWIIPLYHEGREMRSLKPSYRQHIDMPSDVFLTPDFYPGNYVILHNRRLNQWGRYTIVASDVNAIAVNDGPAYDWPEGSKVYPAVLARLTEEPDRSRVTDGAYTVQIRFMDMTKHTLPADTNTPWGNQWWTESQTYTERYRGSTVVTFTPDEGEKMVTKPEHLFSDMDNDVALPFRTEVGPPAMGSQQYRWWLKGRSRYAGFIELLRDLRGRIGQFWLPTFAQDFTVAQNIPSGVNYIVTEISGYLEAGFPADNRQDIAIYLGDGRVLFGRITGVGRFLNQYDVVYLESAFVEPINVASIKRVSLMSLVRLDQDSVELNHPLDTSGLTTCMTTFRTVPQLRVAQGGF